MRLALSVLLLSCALPAAAADRTWTGAAGDGVWSTAANWSGNSVPGGADRAIIAGATVRLTSPATVLAITLNGGATLDATGFVLTLGTSPSAVEAGARLKLGGVPGFNWDALVFDGPLAVRGQLDWANGQIRTTTSHQDPGVKVLTVEADGLMRWPSGGDRAISAAIVNNGTIRWEGGLAVYHMGYPFTNNGTVEMALDADAELRASSFGTGAIVNNGIVQKTGAGTVMFSTVPLRSSGEVDVQEGTILLLGSSRWDNATAFVSAGATLQLAGNGSNAPHTIAGTFTASPEGTIIVNSLPNQSASLLIGEAGARLALGGTGLQVGHGQLGGFDGSSTRDAPTNEGLLRIVGTSLTNISGPFVNEGTLRWEGPGAIVYHLGSPFTNSGTIEIALSADAELRASSFGVGALVNTGTVRKSGAGTATFTSVPLQTIDGHVDVQEGTLRLNATTRWDDASVFAAAGATLLLGHNGNGIWHEVAGTLTGAPEGTFLLDTENWASGLVAAPGGGTVTLGGTGFQVARGYVGGRSAGGNALDAAPVNAGLMRFVGSVHRFVFGTLVNTGTLRWEGGDVYLGRSFDPENLPRLLVEGVLDMDTDAPVRFIADGFTPGPLEVTGTVQHTGPSVTTLEAEFRLNGGTLGVQSGTLVLGSIATGRWTDATVNVATGATLRLASNRGLHPQIVSGTLAGQIDGALEAGMTSGFSVALLADPVRGGTLALGGDGIRLINATLGGGFGEFEPYPAPHNAGVLHFVGPATLYVVKPFENVGQVVWAAVRVEQSVAAPVVNRGTWTIAAANEWAQSGSPAVLTNYGTLRSAGGSTMTATLINHGVLDVAAGTLTIGNGGGFENASTGRVVGTGMLDVSQLPPQRLSNSGIVSPGVTDSVAGTLTWRGRFAPGPDARLEFDLGPTSDRLEVVGPAEFDGALTARRASGFVPVAPTEVVVATSIGGGFIAREGLVDEGAGVYLYPQVDATRLVLAPLGVPPPLGAALTVAPADVVGGAVRSVAISGTGFRPDISARMLCLDCASPTEGAEVPIAIGSLTPTEAATHVDLRDGDLYGTYRVVVTDPRGAEAETVLTVQPIGLVVSVEATTPITTEGSSEPGIFTVRLNRITVAPLRVAYALSGTARQFEDYTTSVLGSAVTLPARTRESRVQVIGLADADAEPAETAVLTLAPSPTYVHGARIATVTIADRLPGSPFALVSALPAAGGNSGPVTVTAFGQAIPSEATLQLVRGDVTIVGQDVRVGSGGTSVSATFDLAGAALGAWTLVAMSSGTEAPLPEPFIVEPSRTAAVWVDLVGPSVVRTGTPTVFNVYAGNTGNQDASGALGLRLPAGTPWSLGGLEVTLPDGTPVAWSALARPIPDGISQIVLLPGSRLPPGSTLLFHVRATLAATGRLSVVWTGS